MTFGELPELDRQGRPKMFYSQRIHDKCYRRPHFDAGQFAEVFDDEGSRKGYCLYKVGCRGPTTYNACSTVRWNEGVSFPIQSGHGCIGCSEPDFWDNGPFYERLTEHPPASASSRTPTASAPPRPPSSASASRPTRASRRLRQARVKSRAPSAGKPSPPEAVAGAKETSP